MGSLNQLDQLDEMDHDQTRPNEVTLSTSTLLGIFFALVLVCAVFFGFGYSLGRHSIQSASTNNAAAAEDPNFNGFKPSPGSPAAQGGSKSTIGDTRSASTTRTAANDSASVKSSPSPTQPPTAPAASSGPSNVTAKNSAAQPSPARVAAPPPGQPASAAVSGNTSSVPAMVQIAAVSHQEDADVLVRALKKRGHDVIARQDPTDKLIHVQLGPFANRKDAEAMRQTLLTEGYNAIVK